MLMIRVVLPIFTVAGTAAYTACTSGTEPRDTTDLGDQVQAVTGGGLSATTVFDQPEQGGWFGYTAHLADVNGDGFADLVWNQLGTINRTYVNLSNGNGTFRRALSAFDQPEQNWSGFTLFTADVNGDGLADLVWNQLGTIN